MLCPALQQSENYAELVKTCDAGSNMQNLAHVLELIQVLVMCRFWWIRIMVAEHGSACQSRWALLSAAISKD